MIRIFVTKPGTDLQALRRQLLRKPTAASATLDRLAELNPHVDLQNLAAGTVLLVPDAPDLKAGATTAVGSENLNELREQIDAGISATVKRVSAGFARVEADRSAITVAVKAAATKRVIESDPALKKQLATADAQFKATKKRATETESELAELQKLAAQELEQLQSLLGGG